MISSFNLEMEERFAPSRPYRLGTRRRRAPKRATQQAVGASRPRGARATSLDTEKLLKTSVEDWRQDQVTVRDRYYQQEILRNRVHSTLRKVWHAHRAAGNDAEAAKWEKAWIQVENCQTQYIGYRAECCGERSRMVAVPIGCNHRLCPVCAWHRSQVARVRVKTLFDRLTHPVLFTLTIPNLPQIQKKYIHHFRKMIRGWLANNFRINGGVYSIEVTFNRAEKSWHLHAHVLADLGTALPKSDEPRIDFFGKKTLPFTAAKWEWEFDWLNMSRDRWIAVPDANPPNYPKVENARTLSRYRRRLGAWKSQWNSYRDALEIWVKAKREHSTLWAKRWNGRHYVLRDNLSEAEWSRYRKLEAWNAKNTRVFYVQPVIDREGAAKEVLKYITKAADFCDIPEAMEGFCNAVQSARLIQTFGSWYGAQLDTTFDPEHMDDWGEMKCACGLNAWKRNGVFYPQDVERDESGRAYLKRQFTQTCRGTVPRPTVRWLGEPEEETEDQQWQTR